MRPRPLIATLVAAVLVAVGLTSCTPAVSATAPPDSSTEHARWGAPAKPDGSIELQKDVVVVGGGRNAVWSGSADGTTWTLDAHAPGMSDLAVGKVLLATGYATGRVAQLTTHGDRTDVVLAPILLTDLVKNGKISVDETLKPGDLRVQGYAGGGVSTLDQGASVNPSSWMRNADDGSADDGDDADLPEQGNSFTHSEKDDDGEEEWSVSGSTSSKGLTFAVSTDAAGLKVSGSATLLFDALHVNLGTVIANSVAGGTTGDMSGIQGIAVDLQAGSQNKGGDTLKKELELPFEIPVQAAVGGIPVFLKLTASVVAGVALVGTDATITGSGEWKVGSGLDVKLNDQQITGDEDANLAVVHSIMDSISGIALGGAVFNLGVKVKIMAGVGAPYFGAGVYGTFSVVVGIGIGSALGSPLALCREASLELDAGTGYGLVSSPSIVTELLSRLPHIKDYLPEDDLTKSTQKALIKKKQIEPDVPVCVSDDDDD